jgi:predicted dehydrogenase
MIRIGIIGVSGFAKEHLKAIDECASTGRCRLAAAVMKPDADYAAFADGFRARGISVYREYQEMFAAERGRIDLVTIPTGIAFHEEHSVAALEAGFHVLCEKPATGSIAEAMNMKAAAERTGKMLAIAYQHLCSPMVQRVKKHTVDGTFGRMLSARTLAFGARDAVYYTRNGWAGKLFHLGKSIYDSPMQNAFAHYLVNMFYCASPEPEKCAQVTSVAMENYRAKGIESADTQWLELTTAEQVPIHFIASHACENTELLTEFCYERGRIEWTWSKTTVYAQDGAGETVVETFDNGSVPIETCVFIDAIEAIRAKRQPACPIAGAMQHTIAIEKGFLSSGGVHPIDRDLLAVSETQGRPDGMDADEAAPYNVVIPGIEKIMRELFKADMGFAAAHLPWAKKPRTISV